MRESSLEDVCKYINETRKLSRMFEVLYRLGDEGLLQLAEEVRDLISIKYFGYPAHK